MSLFNCYIYCTMKKMKKEYKKPEMNVMSFEHTPQLLSGSGEDQWWVPPEEKEGCETPWWCPKES